MAKEKTTYGIAYLAEQTGMSGAVIRGKLRRLGVPKEGRSYEWTKKSDANDVVKQLKESAKAAPKTEKPAKASKPAKAEKAKKESTAKGKGGKKAKAGKGKVDKAA